ncbi:hypothetical protein PaelaDRAFT_0489 [Paenibacillus lactis 154]|uniref:Uncharacterized protein n=1 Tax=Paenibacillus lactis 154 TaxID=743719 RepID=G4H928_9BACL|nr:hypothetical protein PaelaDRAFT_0489 [Paenibacillus lactis 154]
MTEQGKIISGSKIRFLEVYFALAIIYWVLTTIYLIYPAHLNQTESSVCSGALFGPVLLIQAPKICSK